MDNAVNPCIESTYRFIDHVMAHLRQVHAGIQPLQVYHVGGDEVSAGAWSQSPACQRLKLTDSGDLKAHFMHRSSERRPRLAALCVPLQAPHQWRRQGGRGEASPLWVDVQKLFNMCVLSLSWNFFVSHDKYIARPSSKEPR